MIIDILDRFHSSVSTAQIPSKDVKQIRIYFLIGKTREMADSVFISSFSAFARVAGLLTKVHSVNVYKDQ